MSDMNETGDFWKLPPTGEVAGVKTWTYTPTTTMSVTVSASSGLRIAVRLLWDSLVALVRRAPDPTYVIPEPTRTVADPTPRPTKPPTPEPTCFHPGHNYGVDECRWPHN